MINYMTIPITFQVKDRQQQDELEMTLIQRLMQKNGWDFPTPGGNDHDEYDMAVTEVKWYIEQLEDLAQ